MKIIIEEIGKIKEELDRLYPIQYVLMQKGDASLAIDDKIADLEQRMNQLQKIVKEASPIKWEKSLGFFFLYPKKVIKKYIFMLTYKNLYINM